MLFGVYLLTARASLHMCKLIYCRDLCDDLYFVALVFWDFLVPSSQVSIIEHEMEYEFRRPNTRSFILAVIHCTFAGKLIAV